MKKLKATAVSYLNTKPFMYGWFQAGMDEFVDLSLDIPAVGAAKLQTGEVDFGLVPVAVIPHLKQPEIITDFCIGAYGAVRTVVIFSDCPIQEITHLYLDHHSRTSVALAQVLLREYWEISPELLQAEEGFPEKIGGTTAGVIIGDRVVDYEGKFTYTYDLAEAWLKHTTLPFVFAAWVSNKSLPKTFVKRLNEAFRIGIEAIPKLTYLLPTTHPNFDIEEYFTKYIRYDLTKQKRQALDLFLAKLKEKNTNLVN